MDPLKHKPATEPDDVEILEIVGMNDETPPRSAAEVPNDAFPGRPGTVPVGVEAGPPEAQRAQAEAEDRLLRVRADFENFRKRIERERAEFRHYATAALVERLLPVLDNLERALAAASEHDEASLEDGVRLVHRALRDVLGREGLVEIDTDGAFDPHVHEALLTQPSDEPEGTVLEVIEKGYRVGDRVLRPARVVVAAPEGQRDGDEND